ncbi:Long-chain-fatty-acid--CoA ligase [hydrothermal vent metagenome]|uniref:Long-chain-fatty-acid--CoA ligase n=1 Tax=hydrothermal vent metagenome TaxID=652676 RepID=A0A3B0U806_9ZZZZ
MNDAAGGVGRELNTFPKLLLRNAGKWGDRPAIREKDLGIWQTWTWSEVLDEVRAFAIGLADLGFKPGDKVAVVGDNRPRLYWTVMAAQSLGGVPVPVYADAVADEVATLLAHAEVKFAVAEDQEQVDKLQQVQDRLNLAHIIYDDPRGLDSYAGDKLSSFEAVQKRGRELMARSATPGGSETADAAGDWLAGVAAGSGEDISIILYTSGTTGKSKGVMLSAERCIAAASDTVKFDRLTEEDEAIAYLPLAWVGDHYLNYAQAMVAGFCISCPENTETVMADLKEIGPSYYFAPPRVFENLLTSVTIRMEDASRLKQAMFGYFLKVAGKWGEKLLNGDPVPLGARVLYKIGDALVYAPLKNVLGFSKIRVAYTAGEAIGPDLFSFYRSLGINLKQLYGQTEAFLYVTVQPDGQVRAETVGPAAPNTQVRIADNGEVQFRSPGQFIGYYKEPDKTAETVTDDGFVKTGDAGYFDPDGHLKIIDRARDVGKLVDGTLFAPKYLENKLKFFPNILEAVALGDGKPYASALINIDLSAVSNWAERNNVAYGSYQELAANTQVYDMIAADIDKMNASLATDPNLAGSQIQRFLILHKELDPDDGELTRTRKVRRNIVAEKYAPLLEALFDGSKSAHIDTEVTFEDGRKGRISADLEIRDMAMHKGAANLAEAAE